MRGHPDDPTGKTAIASLRLVDEPVRGAGSDGSVSNQRPPPKEQRWGSLKTLLSETTGSRVPAKQHAERCPHPAGRNSDEEAELWRCGIAAAVLFSIVAMLSSRSSRSLPSRFRGISSGCRCRHGPCPEWRAGSARPSPTIRAAVWSAGDRPYCFRR